MFPPNAEGFLSGHTYRLRVKDTALFLTVLDATHTPAYRAGTAPVVVVPNRIHGTDPFSQQWQFTAESGPVAHFFVRSMLKGTYLGASKTGPEQTLPSGIQVITYPIDSDHTSDNSRWYRRPGPTEAYFALEDQNLPIRFNLHVEALQENHRVFTYAPNTKIPNQLWAVTRCSRSSEEVGHILAKDHRFTKESTYEFLEKGIYTSMSPTILDKIWAESKLLVDQWRASSFDCLEFASVMRAGVSNWQRETVHCPGIAVLFGIAYADTEHGRNVFNFYLSPGLNQIVFYDPKNGEETFATVYRVRAAFY